MNQASKKIRRPAQRQQHTLRGRPAQLEQVRLEPPDIWTNAADFRPLQLLCFLDSIGRHFSPHLAGQTGNNTDARNERLRICQEQKVYYECAQAISEKYFDHFALEQRCFPFFFRIPRTPLFLETIEDLRVEGYKGYILQFVLCLLNHKFIRELVEILNSDLSDERLAIQFLSTFSLDQMTIQNMKLYPEIVQNAYIRFIIEDMISNRIDYLKAKKDINQNFQSYISSNQALETITSWIQMIRQIMAYEYEHQQQMQSPFNFIDVGDYNEY